MSSKKISELTENTSPETDVQIPIVNDPDGSPETQRTSFANLLKKQNQGVGSAYNNKKFDDSIRESIVYTEMALTDPSHNYAGYRLIGNCEYTANTGNGFTGLHVESTPIINSGVTNSDLIIGATSHCLRNRVATDSDDDGTLSNLRGHHIHYGHYDRNVAATPITTSAYGMVIYADNSTGTIVNMTDLRLHSRGSIVVTGLHYSIKQEDSDAVNYFAGVVNLDNYVIQKITVTTDNTDGADTYTTAQMLGKLIRRGTGDEITGAVIDITDTAANIVDAIPNCQVGSGFKFYVSNEDSTHTIQVDGGTGVTMSPNDPSTAIPVNSTGHFMVVVTNATASSEAVTIHCVGIALH